MTVEKTARDSSPSENTVTVSESAKRQIAVNVSESRANSTGPNLGPGFFDGFPDGPAGPNR